jgi:tetrahydromethanopterin S-methyltransferase subunit A
VCVILDTFDFKIPSELQELVLAATDAGAALAGMLQTENVGMEKVLCNIVANPNIRYVVLCGRESPGHLPGETLLALNKNGVNDGKQIIGSTAPTPYLHNIPLEVIERFNKQIVTVVNLLCPPGESDTRAAGLDPKVIEKAVWSCFQENAVAFRDYTLYDMGAFPEPALFHKIVSVLEERKPQQAVEPGKSKMGLGLTLNKFLPQTNCRECGRKTCLAFAIDLAKGKAKLEDCPPLGDSEHAADRQALAKLME